MNKRLFKSVMAASMISGTIGSSITFAYATNETITESNSTDIIYSDNTESPETIWSITPSISSWSYGSTSSTPVGTSTLGDVTFTYSTRTSYAFSEDGPSAVGDYYMKASVTTANEEGEEVEYYALVPFSINKTTQGSPELTFENNTIKGITETMEYSTDQENYTAFSEEEIEKGEAVVSEDRTYYVRYKETESVYASVASKYTYVAVSESSDSNTNESSNQEQIQTSKGADTLNKSENSDMKKTLASKGIMSNKGRQEMNAINMLKGMKNMKSLKKTTSSSSSSSSTYTSIDSSTHNPTDIDITDMNLSSMTKTISYGEGKITFIINDDDDLNVSIKSMQRLIDACLSDSQKLKVANGTSVTLRLTVELTTPTSNEKTLIETAIKNYSSISTFTPDEYIKVTFERKWNGGSYTTIEETNRNILLTINTPDSQVKEYAGIAINGDDTEAAEDIDSSSSTFTYSIGYSSTYALGSIVATKISSNSTKTVTNYNALLYIPLAFAFILEMIFFSKNKAIRIASQAITLALGAVIFYFALGISKYVFATALIAIVIGINPLVETIRRLLNLKESNS